MSEGSLCLPGKRHLEQDPTGDKLRRLDMPKRLGAKGTLRLDADDTVLDPDARWTRPFIVTETFCSRGGVMCSPRSLSGSLK